MKNNLKLALQIFYSSLILLLSAKFCFAVEVSLPGLTLNQGTEIIDYARYFINLGISAAGVLAIGSLVFGGMHYLISMGMGKMTKEGLEWVKSGLYGMGLLLFIYLIIFTVNPALVSSNLKELLPISSLFGDSNTNTLNKNPITTYQEIPLGKLAETVLSKEIDCYDFDNSGNPIQNKTQTDNGGQVPGPTFLVHDRVDCLAKLNFAIEKKSEIVAKLSKVIVNLMNECGCKTSGCNVPEGATCPTLGVGNWVVGQKCGADTACQCQTQNTCGLDQTEYKMCPTGYKKLIEHGPLSINGTDLTSSLSSLFPKAKKSDLDKASTCIPGAIVEKTFQGLDEFRPQISSPAGYIEKQLTVDKKTVTAIDETKWDTLRLIDQISYLRQKVKQISDDLQKDLNNLDTIKTTLSKCYLAKPYLEFIKTAEQTNKDNETIVIQKNYDNYTGEPTDISKYCSGYNYANSSCQVSCENMCPVSSTQNANLYASCQTCLPTDPPSCLQNQKTCMAQKINERLCNQNPKGINTFSQCMNSCKKDCTDNCDIKYKVCKDSKTIAQSCLTNKFCSNLQTPVEWACGICTYSKSLITPFNADEINAQYKPYCDACSSGIIPTNLQNDFNTKLKNQLGTDNEIVGNKICLKNYLNFLVSNSCMQDLERCKTTCGSNSQCLLNNQDKCLYNYNAIKNCSDQNSSQATGLKNCIDNAALCPLGSQQNAGYADCIEKDAALNGKDFSSSALYKTNKSLQKCQSFYSETLGNILPGINNCQSPETSKCPNSSNCPECPCDTTALNSGTAWYTEYTHMKSITVSPGDQVNKGQVIGQVSNTSELGTSSHLHFLVAFQNNSGIDVATSFDVSSKIAAANGGEDTKPGVYITPLEKYVTQKYKDYVLNTLEPPVDTSYCNWNLLLPPSILHEQTAAYAQDWICDNGSQEGAPVRVMSGGSGIKSTVESINPSYGSVVIKHEIKDQNVLTPLLGSDSGGEDPIKNTCLGFGGVIDPEYCKNYGKSGPDYRVVSGECGNYVYNDDPLTFYCKQKWWDDTKEKSPAPIGEEKVCKKANEIPVGQAVDDIGIWGQNFANQINKLLSVTDGYINHLKELGQESGYCECGSTCGNSEGTCNSGCEVAKTQGSGTNEGPTLSCQKAACAGNPCLKMINMLMGKIYSAKCPINQEIKGPNWYKDQLLSFYNIMNDLAIKSRTEVVKKLTYSREKTNECSVIGKTFDVTKNVKMLNCTRAVDEIALEDPQGKTIINNKEIPYPCYGVVLGEMISSGYNYSTNYSNPGTQTNTVPETDNWFCCEQYNKP